MGYAMGAAVQKGLGFLLFLTLANLLPASEYAIFGLMYALQAGIATFAMAGTVETAVGAMKSNKESNQRLAVFRQVKFLFIVIASATIVAGGVIFTVIGQISPSAVLLAVLFGGISALVTIQAQLSRLEEDHTTTLITSNIPPICGILAAAIAAFLDFQAQSIFLIMSTGMLFGYLLILRFWRGGIRGWEKPADLGGGLWKLHPFLVIAIFDWLSGYGSLFLVEASFSHVEVARFVFAYTLSSLMHLIATSLNQIWSPRIYVELQKGNLTKLHVSSRIFYIVQGASIGFMGCLIIAGISFLTYLESFNLQNYHNMIYETLFLLLAYAFVIPWYYAQNFFYYHGEGSLLLKITLVSGVAGLALWFVAVTQLGSIGSYVGFFALMATKSAVGAISAWRKWKVPIAWEGTAIAAIVMVGCAYTIASLSGQH